MAEMTTYLPVSSPFIRFAGRYVDEAFGVAAGWNFFIFEAALVPFEIVACNVIIHFWSDVVPAGGIIAITIVLYAYVHLYHSRSLWDLLIEYVYRVINLMAVKWYANQFDYNSFSSTNRYP